MLHYVANRDLSRAGRVAPNRFGVRAGLLRDRVTRTWPVDGRFTPKQRALYDVVLAAQEAAIAQVRPGIRRSVFHDTAVRTIVEGLIGVGLLAGSVDENVERETYRDYYMHGTGHWLGLDVHDAGAYRDADDEPIVLLPGMVTTVEPGIYVHRDLTCDERFKGIGIRIEDDVLVTAGGNENLTAATPKRVEELEAIVGSGSAGARARVKVCVLGASGFVGRHLRKASSDAATR